jgi:N-glycosylase/DNA lyase
LLPVKPHAYVHGMPSDVAQQFVSGIESGRCRVAQRLFPAQNYDLAATLRSGQAFRWQAQPDGWEGVVAARWVRLQQREDGILAETLDGPESFWPALAHYLQLDLDLASVLATFPDDEPMRAAVNACHGLRLLRQDSWECLASFILSSTKQIVQIQQIVALLCERFGHAPVFSFPSAQRLAECAEPDLRACKMGFRAPNLLRSAKMISAGDLDLCRLPSCTVDAARAELLRLPGVGNKIANCVLLFAYGFQQAFPVDVWIMKALRQLYFPRRRVSSRRLERFVATHFGPNAGYAQQYLFHYMRTRARSLDAPVAPG